MFSLLGAYSHHWLSSEAEETGRFHRYEAGSSAKLLERTDIKQRDRDYTANKQQNNTIQTRIAILKSLKSTVAASSKHNDMSDADTHSSIAPALNKH